MITVSKLWTPMWFLSDLSRLNALSHTWHLYTFCPLWFLLCTTKPCHVLNPFPQTVHSSGFSVSVPDVGVDQTGVCERTVVAVEECSLTMWLCNGGFRRIACTCDVTAVVVPITGLMAGIIAVLNTVVPEVLPWFSCDISRFLSACKTPLCTWRSCSCKMLLLLKQRWHSEHLYDVVSSLWALPWLSSCWGRSNVLPHRALTHDFCPQWLRLWWSKLPLCVNRLSHTVQTNGFSPVWICLWRLKFPLSVNRLSHTVQINGFSPAWVCLWSFKSSFCVNRLSHTVHTHGFSTVWIRLWTFKFPLSVNRLSHTVHKYGLGLSSRGCSVTSASMLTSSVSSKRLSPTHRMAMKRLHVKQK